VPNRALSAEEAALWARVIGTVRPLRAVAPVGRMVLAAEVPKSPVPRVPPIAALVSNARSPAAPKVQRLHGATLDGGWDRRLGKGAIVPDDVVDLHGHTLASAHAMLDARLGAAIGRGDRVVLLVTGRPPRPDSERPHARGAIRAAVTDWLAASRHSSAIASVRAAHPRHGGAGALYVILRRRRD